MSETTPYIVSARKYRPATFDTVVGQPALTQTLKNAIDTGRLAQAYLFCGPRGVGKTSCARIFAKTINCLHPTPEGEACGECDSCRSIDQGNSFNIIELDAATNNSVDDIRALGEQANVPPQMGKYRVFIIDEVHMLSSSAFNAFLKTLEEPPKYVIFILATTEKHKVIPTILSRCQIYDFKRITVPDIIAHLQYVATKEGIEAEASALGVIAQKADGAMRDALSIFDQVAASSQGKITYESTIANLNVLDYEYYFRLVDAFVAGDVAGALLLYKEIRDKGFDSQFFINGLGAHIRDLMVSADPRTLPLLEVSQDVAQRYAQQAVSMPIGWHYAAVRILNQCDLDYRIVSNKQLHVELALIRLCQLLHPSEIKEQPVPKLKQPVAAPTATAPNPAPKPNPQPQPQPQPKAQQPQPQALASQTPPRVAPQAPKVRPRTPNTANTFRLNQRPAAEEKSEGDHPAPALRTKPITQEGLLQAWTDFQGANPDKQLLLTAMRNAQPRLEAENVVALTVDNPVAKEIFEDETGALTAALRDALENDHLALKIDYHEPTDQGERILTPQDWLKHVVSENPGVKHLLEVTKARLV